MVVFWLLVTAMTAVALAFVLVPLLRAARAAAGPSEAEANLEVLRSQRQEIEADLAAGTLPASAREEALAELVGRAADDLTDSPPPPTATDRKPWVAAVAAGVAVPALAFGLYLALGTPTAADPSNLAASGMPTDQHQVAELVEKLAAKVRERPDDAQGWALLARSMAALERWPEAAQAYAHLAKLVPGDPTILADYADVLGMAQGRNLSGRPVEIARQALEIDPRHQKALALLASAAMDAGDVRGALGYWQRLAAQLPPDSQDAREVAQIIDELRARAGPAVAAAPRMFEKPAAPPPAQPVAAGKTVTGTVSVAPAVRASISGNETVYIFARSEGGPRTPLAVLRLSAKELPIRFALDDSQAMAPGVNISSAEAVRVEARISRTGDATPKPGDLVGASAVVKPGARDVQVVVDKVLP